jgi:hypothetical protein
MWHCHHRVRLMGCRVVQLIFHKSHLNVYVVGLYMFCSSSSLQVGGGGWGWAK